MRTRARKWKSHILWESDVRWFEDTTEAGEARWTLPRAVGGFCCDSYFRLLERVPSQAVPAQVWQAAIASKLCCTTRLGRVIRGRGGSVQLQGFNFLSCSTLSGMNKTQKFPYTLKMGLRNSMNWAQKHYHGAHCSRAKVTGSLCYNTAQAEGQMELRAEPKRGPQCQQGLGWGFSSQEGLLYPELVMRGQPIPATNMVCKHQQDKQQPGWRAVLLRPEVPGDTAPT